jgi:hypothetical protein
MTGLKKSAGVSTFAALGRSLDSFDSLHDLTSRVASLDPDLIGDFHNIFPVRSLAFHQYLVDVFPKEVSIPLKSCNNFFARFDGELYKGEYSQHSRVNSRDFSPV